MLGRKQEFNLHFQQILDGMLLVFAFWLSHLLRMLGALWLHWSVIPPLGEFRWVLFLLLPFGPIFLELQGFYHQVLQKTIAKSLTQIAKAGGFFVLLLFSFSFFFRLDFASRSVLPLFGVVAMIFLLIREQMTIFRVRRKALAEQFRENVLFAGTSADIQHLRGTLTPEQLITMDIVGEFDIEDEPLSALVESLHKLSVSRVIFAGGHSNLNQLQKAIAACELEGVEAWLVADFIKTSIARPDFDMFGPRPVIVFRTTPDISWALFIKGIIDRVGALILFILTLPLILVAAIGILLTSPGPVIFRQKRAGKHGKPFTMYKFRTMHTDAEMRQSELVAYNLMSGPVFKLENDPRITGFGKWLRKTSIDELPQLINVLQGTMSLVGPRPLPIYEVEKFESSSQRRRLSVKPGLTCLWQVEGRNTIKDFNDWVRLDLKYIDNWSVWLDLKILLKTVPAVLFGFGAK